MRAIFTERSAALWLAVATFVAAAIFTLWPQVDLAVSGLFYSAADGFALDRVPVLVGLRWFVWHCTEALVALALAGLALSGTRWRLLGLGARLWGYVVLLFALGPGLLVNGILKSHWGRARPADITLFGGTHDFTPALVPADQCLSNCSFVSGEGASSVALMIAGLTILAALGGRLPPGLRRGLALTVVAAGVTGAALRVMGGRHFLSDTVFAALFIAAIALGLFRLVRPLHRG